MVEYGWRMFYFYNLRGCDTLIESTKHKYWMYCGQLCSDSLKHFDYYRQMLRRKLRVLYAKKKRTEWFINGSEQVELGIIDKIIEDMDEVIS